MSTPDPAPPPVPAEVYNTDTYDDAYRGLRVEAVARLTAAVNAAYAAGVAAGRTAAAADLPSDTGEIRAWLSRHGLSTTPGVGVVLAAVRLDILGFCSACGPADTCATKETT